MQPDSPAALVFGTSSQTWATNPWDGFRGYHPALGSATRCQTAANKPRILTICQRCAALAQ